MSETNGVNWGSDQSNTLIFNNYHPKKGNYPPLYCPFRYQKMRYRMKCPRKPYSHLWFQQFAYLLPECLILNESPEQMICFQLQYFVSNDFHA